jgi:hypothetical protein
VFLCALQCNPFAGVDRVLVRLDVHEDSAVEVHVVPSRTVMSMPTLRAAWSGGICSVSISQ